MFELFTLGDTQTFAEVLNGIAMMFNNSPIFKGNGPLQIGFGAFVGVMVLFTVMIYKAAFEQRFEWKTIIVPLIFYIILTVPKTTVVISDIYNVEAPQRVDNVPIGIAVPASVISGISSLLTTYIEKAFYVLPMDNINHPSTQLTQDGFLTPLQVLNAIRYDNLNTDHPLLQKAFNKIYASCIIGNDQWNADEYTRAKDASAYFQTVLNSTEQLVTFTVSQAGMGSEQTMSCADAGSYVTKAMQVHLTGANADPTGLLGSNFKKTSFPEKMARAMAVNNAYGKLKGATGTIRYTDAQVASLISSISGMAIHDSRSFMMNVLFDPMVRTATKCTSEFSLDQISKCAVWISTVEQWKDRSAASGTSFLKKMKNGQNMMILVGFMLFPFMVFMIMLQGMASKKMVVGYIAFMISNYLWLPMAAIINFYGQYTFQDGIYMLKLINPDGLFTINQVPHLYDVITTKLSVANNAMGMVPVFCSMLFGGMMWGVSSFSKAINPADGGYDAKVNSKTIMASAPLNSQSSVTNKDGFGSTAIMGVGSAEVKASTTLSVAKSKALEYDDQINNKIARLEQLSERSSEGIAHTLGSKQGTRNSTSNETEQASNYENTRTNTDGKVTDGTLHTEKKVGDSDATIITNEANSSTAIRSTLGASVNAAFGGTGSVKANAGVNVSGDNMSVNAKTLTVERKVVNQATEVPTYNTKTGDQSGITGGSYKELHNIKSEDLKSKILKSNDANFKASSLNEIIQKDQSHAFSLAEKQEAAKLASEVRSLSSQKAESLQFVMATTMTDSDISGRSNVLAPNSKLYNESLHQTDLLGRKSVENWEQLKADAEKTLRYGGNSTPDGLENAKIVLAAKHSKNSDVMLSAIDAALQTTTVSNTFRENHTFEKLAVTDNQRLATQADLNKIAETINTRPVDDAQKRFGGSISKAKAEINDVQGKVIDAENLSGQIVNPVQKVVVNVEQINKQEALAQINKEYNIAAAALAAQGPSVLNPDGTIKTPQANSYDATPTVFDEKLQKAQQEGKTDVVAQLLNEQQQLEAGYSEKVKDIVGKYKEKMK